MGKPHLAPLAILFWAVSAWGFCLTFGYLEDKIGLIPTLASLFILPVIHYLAPVYAGFADGYWLPFHLSWGIGAAILAVRAVAGPPDDAAKGAPP